MRSMFDQAKAEQVIEQVWQGKSLRAAADVVGVKAPTFLLWADKNPPIAEQYARAIAERATVHAERIESMVDKIESGEIAPDQGRVMLDALKWTASKLNPKRYGDRVQVDADMTLRVSIADPARQLRATLLPAATAALAKPEEDPQQE